MQVLKAPYAVSYHTRALLSSLRNTFTVNFTICQHSPVWSLVGLSPLAVAIIVWLKPCMFEFKLLQHRADESNSPFNIYYISLCPENYLVISVCNFCSCTLRNALDLVNKPCVAPWRFQSSSVFNPDRGSLASCNSLGRIRYAFCFGSYSGLIHPLCLLWCFNNDIMVLRFCIVIYMLWLFTYYIILLLNPNFYTTVILILLSYLILNLLLFCHHRILCNK